MVPLGSQPCGPADITGSWCPELEKDLKAKARPGEGLEVMWAE